MAQKKSDKNTVVTINLDRPRVVKYGHKALKQLAHMTGRKLNEMNTEDFDFDELEKLIYCGLLSDAKEHGESLKLEDMEDLLDKADSFASILDVMNEALDKAFQQTEKQKN